MAAANRLRAGARARPAAITLVLTVVGYGLVVGTFAGVVDIYPDLSKGTVELLTHLIAVINTVALSTLLVGVYFIRNREIRKHRAAMLTAFALIILFLVVYLFRVGGGETKSLVAPDLVRIVYLVMLAIHILLSIVSVPVVLYAVVLGLSHTPAELQDTPHARVGRIAAGAWILSLALGIITYIMLNHIYSSEPLESLLVVALAGTTCLRGKLGESGLL